MTEVTITAHAAAGHTVITANTPESAASWPFPAWCHTCQQWLTEEEK